MTVVESLPWGRIFVICQVSTGTSIDHYLPLTELSLGEVMIETGFTLEKQIPRFLPYTMSHGRQPLIWMLRLYLKLTFAWPLFGKQFLLVARK